MVCLSAASEGGWPLVDPDMLCPICESEFAATGMTFRLFGRPPLELGDDAVLMWAASVVDQLFRER
jgi:hypothetical protein